VLLDQAGWHGGKVLKVQAICRSCRCRRAHPNSTARKTSGRPYVRCRCVCASSTLCDERGLRRMGRRRASRTGDEPCTKIAKSAAGTNAIESSPSGSSLRSSTPLT
jgi:hypothetical protein